MATEVLTIHKVTALPASGSRVPHAIYIVGPAANPDHCELYVTSTTGASIRRIINTADVQTMIGNAISGGSNINKIVDNIAARDSLAKTDMMQVYVVTASGAGGDPSVASGGAMYMWRASNSSWIKLYEAESLDIQQTWNALSGKPTSTPAQIDAAVAASHGHANMTQLNKIGEDGSGNLTYGGSLPKIAWSGVDW